MVRFIFPPPCQRCGASDADELCLCNAPLCYTCWDDAFGTCLMCIIRKDPRYGLRHERNPAVLYAALLLIRGQGMLTCPSHR